MKDYKLKNYGWVAHRITPEHYVMGGVLAPEVIQPDGDWSAYLPTYEPQFGGDWDSAGCTVWGSENQIEILMKKMFGGDYNYSERYIYNNVKIRQTGTDPQLTYEAERKNGLLPDS